MNYIYARIFWVCGLVFLLLTVAFGGLSKVMYPVNIGSDISEDVQQFIGILQITTAGLLLWKPYRRWGIALAGLNFLGWIIWFSTTDISMVIFCIIGLCVSSMLLFCKFNFYPPEKEFEPSIEELATGSLLWSLMPRWKSLKNLQRNRCGWMDWVKMI